MLWTSIDPATVSGVAQWGLAGRPDAPATGRVRPMGKGGAWVYEEGKTKAKGTEHLVWRCQLMYRERVVVEVGRGASRNADASLGARRGYIRAVCDSVGAEYIELELSTWRRAIADEMRELDEPLTWGTGDATKAQALTLVTRLYGLSGITADEADAVLIGRAAQRLRLV